MRSIICWLLEIYFYAVLAWVVLSWVQVFLDRIIYPVILPLRRVLPPLRLGGMALDLSPLVLMLGISLLRRFVC